MSTFKIFVQKLTTTTAQFNRTASDLLKGIQSNPRTNAESGAWTFVVGTALGVVIGFYLRRILA